ncbi:MAG: hypothetical protein K2X87_17095 [Gemmataceae bacterium]|nr:hypothetical protein [Gemmataceae bacterium]
MARVLLAAPALLAAALLAPADDPKAEKVKFEAYTDHFEKNNAGLKGDESFLLVNTREGFDKVFGVGVVAGGKQKFVPKDAFDTKVAAAVIHRGDAPWTYKVEGVTADGGTVTVRYSAKKGEASTAKFASPLIVTVPKAGVKKVVFVENGKEVGTAELK